MLHNPSDVDVVIVGAGIAGSALAWRLAQADISTLVLERQATYHDQVRGEVINCWGIPEARRLGIEDALSAAGGHYAPRFVGYDETLTPAEAESNIMDVSNMLPDVPGVLTVGHPELCTALANGAEKYGAHIVRGVTVLEAQPGADQSITAYRTPDGSEHCVTSSIIVGADGRSSRCRKFFDIDLTQTAPNSLGGGLLVAGLESWSSDTTWIGTEGDLLHFIYPRPGGLARLYLLHSPHDKGRFAGPTSTENFINAYRHLTCVPDARNLFSEIRPAYPTTKTAFFPMNDSWCDRIAVPGAVLIGDAAGWSDPVIGQGLCVALRDARIVSDAMLSGGSAWTTATFRYYETERRTRMERLRKVGRIRSAMGLTFTDDGRRRRRRYAQTWPTDPVLAATRLTTFKGPHNVPTEAFHDETIDYLLTL